VRVVAARHDLLHARVVGGLPHRDKIGAAREVAARAGEDRAADLGILVDVLVSEYEAREHRPRQRVLLLGPVHREDDDVVVTLDRAVLCADVQDLRHEAETRTGSSCAARADQGGLLALALTSGT
jgi:hypothetical protein